MAGLRDTLETLELHDQDVSRRSPSRFDQEKWNGQILERTFEQWLNRRRPAHPSTNASDNAAQTPLVVESGVPICHPQLENCP